MAQINPLILAAVNGPFSQLRTGTIASATLDTVVVVVGGTSFKAQAIDSYTPVEGDLVTVLRQDATWLVLGRLSGQGPSEVTDGSFEDSPPGLLPVDWNLYNVSGVSTAVVVVRDGAPGGTQTLRVFPAAGGTNVSLVYSDPIDVVPGETWNLSAYVGGDYEETAAHTADADLIALWFANDTNLYPTTSVADSVVASLADVTQLPPFTGISGPVTVPVGAAVMRVALRSSVTTGQALEWDFVTAREASAGEDRSPRGHINFTAINADTAPTVGTATAITTPDITFLPGRAYRLAAKGHVVSSVAGDTVRIRLVKSATSVLDTFGAIQIASTNGSSGFYFETIVINAGATTLTGPVSMTYARNTGTGNVFVGASAQNPSYIEVLDIGPASSYSGAFQVP